MSEMVKTQVYVGVAIVLAALAVFWKSGQVEMQLNDMIGKDLFTEFTSADAATNLTITNYDTNFDKPVSFQVSRDKKTDQWVIPSEDDYPADAEEQMQKAVTALIGLEVVDVASEVAKDHELFGVLEPTNDVAAGSNGIGMLVEVADARQNELAHLIIGKQDANDNELRFVRVRDEDVTYVVKLDLTNFTTEFNKWIEEDLLALNPLDIRTVALKDYAILEVVDPRTGGPIKQLIQRSDTALAWNQEESKWNIGHMHEFKEPNEPTPTELSESEELNSERLNTLKNALDDLKIVGVKQKPAETNQVKLQEYGFYPFPTTDENNKQIKDVRSANGEVHVSLQDGIQYILRFGDIVPLDAVKATSEDSTDNIYRYLVVAAKLDKSQIPPPALEPEPELPAAPEEKPDDALPAKETPKKPVDPAPVKKAPEDSEKKPAAEKKPADPGNCDDDEKQAADEKKPAEKETDKKPSDEKKPADDKAKPAANTQPPAEPPVTLSKEQIEKIVEGIRKENERKLNEYQEKLTAAEKRVEELNTRFANWCFIIDEKVYNQIHLSQTDVIKEKEESDLGDFRNLDPQNPNPPGTPPPGGNPLLPNLPPQP